MKFHLVTLLEWLVAIHGNWEAKIVTQFESVWKILFRLNFSIFPRKSYKFFFHLSEICPRRPLQMTRLLKIKKSQINPIIKVSSQYLFHLKLRKIFFGHLYQIAQKEFLIKSWKGQQPQFTSWFCFVFHITCDLDKSFVIWNGCRVKLYLIDALLIVGCRRV